MAGRQGAPRAGVGPRAAFDRAACVRGALVFAAAWLSGGLAAQPAAPEVTVVHPVAREVVDWDEFPGRFRAIERVEVESRVEGYLVEAPFREGERVAAGDVLFRIDPRPFEAAVARAEARLARATAERALDELELSRLRRLLEREAVSQDEVDVQRAALDGAIADVQAAEAELETARLDREYATIRAPIDGRVSSRSVDPGDLIQPGASGREPLTTLVSVAPVHFVFDVSEADYLRYRRQVWAENGAGGQRVRVRLLDEREYSRAGEIEFQDNRIDGESATLRLRAVLPNEDGLVLPGLFGRARIAASRPYRALLVPDQAIISDQDRKMVLTVTGEGEVRPRSVRLGPLVEQGLRVVRDGLSAEALVIVEGILQARAAPRVTHAEPRSVAEFVRERGGP